MINGSMSDAPFLFHQVKYFSIFGFIHKLPDNPYWNGRPAFYHKQKIQRRVGA